MYAASRLLVVAAVAAGVAAQGQVALLDALGFRWDSKWYLQVAAFGYAPDDPRGAVGEPGDLGSSGAFFPLYPLLVRAAVHLGDLRLQTAGLAVSWVFGASAALLLWCLVRRLCDDAVADRATALFCFFPGSAVLSLAYAEGVMLTAAIGCLWALLQRRWLLAGVAAALATASRPNAVVLVACCAWAAVAAWRADGDRRAFVAPALAPLGFLAHLGLLWVRTGEPLAWFVIQRVGWNERFDLGVRTLARFAWLGDPTRRGYATTVVATLGVGVVTVTLVLLWRWRPPAVLTIYTLGILVLALGSQTLGARPRFVLTAFPLLVALARATRGATYHAILATSAALLGVTAILYTTGGAVP